MFSTRTMLFYVLLLITSVYGRKGVGSCEQDWGYITVRPNAHMFWWLYYTTYNNVSNYTGRPLIIWLQGGPGMPSSGYGNFLEIGPQDVYLQDRNGSFVENFNLLFVDNPVGVGYSYVSDNKTKLTLNGDDIGEDLYTFFREFLIKVHPEFRNVSIYVFGESYGGKMATDFVFTIKEKEKSGNEYLCNLIGLALGDAYISPVDYINHYAPLAFNLIWDYKTVLENIMNNDVKDILNITANITWKFFQDDVYDSLKADLIKSVTHKIEKLLNTSDIKILVYNGILDFLVNTAGTISWLDSLNWKGKERWYNATPSALIIDEVAEGYSKRVDNLVFYAILRAGHSIPLDNLPVINKILELELLN